jgi:hypothetical protein
MLSSQELTKMIKDVRAMIASKKEICNKLSMMDTTQLEDMEIVIQQAVRDALFYEWEKSTNIETKMI